MSVVAAGWNRVRRLIQVALLVVVLKLARFLREFVRRHRVATRLPTVPARDGPGLLGICAGKDFVGNRRVTVDSVREGFARGLREAIQKNKQMRDDGVVLVWFLNSRFSRVVPNSLFSVAVFGESKVRKILAAKNQHLYSKGTSYVVSHQLIGDSVLATSGEQWHRQRAVLDIGFKKDILNRQTPVITACVDQFVEKILMLSENNDSVNILEESLKLTMDVLGHTAFSYDFKSVRAKTTKEAPLYNTFQTLLTVLNTRVFVQPLHYVRNASFLPVNYDFDRAIQKLSGVVKDIISRRRGVIKNRPSNFKNEDLLDVMLTDTTLSDDELRWNIQTMLFAGHDTTAANLTWLLYLLATHPKVLERVRKESDTILGPIKEPSLEQLDSLAYLQCVMLEALRLYPSAAFTRNTLQDVDLEGFVIPKGTEILIAPYLMHRNPDVYDRPNDFVPERWMEEKSSQNITLKSQISIFSQQMPFMPFSHGQRNCVGRYLALTELAIAVVKVTHSCDLEFVENDSFQPDPSLFLTFVPKGVQLRFQRRTPQQA